MTRRASVIWKVLTAALLNGNFELAADSYLAHAQGAIAQGDPTGAATGTAKDVPVKDAANPTLAEVMETVGHNKIAINFVWTLLAGFLVMFMQAGFAMVETGFTRAKNAAHTLSHELHGLSASACSATGSAASPCRWEASAPSPPWAAPRRSTTSSPSPVRQAFGLFGHEGLLPERRHLRRRRLRALPLPDGVHGHGGDHSDRRHGRALEVLVVHRLRASSCRCSSTRSSPTGSGAAAGCDAGRELRPRPRPRRLRRFLGRAHGGRRRGARRRHRPRPAHRQVHQGRQAVAMPGHDIPMALAGTFILAFGWFGFNPGSTLAGSDLRIARGRRPTPCSPARAARSPRCSTCGSGSEARSEHDRATACWPAWWPSPRPARSSTACRR